MRLGKVMTWTGDDSAAAPLLTFIVGIGVFVVAFSVVMNFMADVGAHDAGSETASAAEAHGAAALLTSTPGTPPDWSSTVPTRIGLLKPGTSTTMSLEKFRALHGWTSTSDYDAARASLGLGDRQVFIRTAPSYVEGNIGLADLRVAYVGDYEVLIEQGVSVAESAAIDKTDVVFTNAEVDRLGGSGGGDKYQDTEGDMQRQLMARLAGFEGLGVDGGGTSYWKVVNTTDHGAMGGLEHVLTPSYNAGGYTYDGAALSILEQRLLVTTLDLRDVPEGAHVWFNATHYADGSVVIDGLVSPTTDDYGYVEVDCVASCPGTGLPEVAGGYHYDNGTDADAGFAELSVSLDRFWGQQVEVRLVWHVADDLDAKEGWFLGPITATKHVDGTSTVLYANPLDYTTTRYDALVVGSDVNQVLFDQDFVKQSFIKWVEKGGHLMVLGSDEANHGWLSGNDGFITGNTMTASGEPLLDDADLGHPLLTTPHALRPSDFVAAPKILPAVGPIEYQTLVEQDIVNGDPRPILAVSRPSSKYDGNLLLTSYTPGEFPTESREQWFNNTFAFMRHNELYVEFNPGIPDTGRVASAGRYGLVDATDLGLGVVEVAVTVYVWD